MPSDERLERLARRAASGDRDALRAIYDLAAPRLVREVLAPLLRDRQLCEDVLRDVFTGVIASPAALAAGPVLPYLARIARNRALDVLRRRATEERLREAVGHEAARATVPDPESLVADAEERLRLRSRVEEALARMNPRYARALRLRLLEEQSREACAAELGVRLGTFDVIFFRACKQFRAVHAQLRERGDAS